MTKTGNKINSDKAIFSNRINPNLFFAGNLVSREHLNFEEISRKVRQAQVYNIFFKHLSFNIIENIMVYLRISWGVIIMLHDLRHNLYY